MTLLVDRVSKRFGSVVALDDLAFEVARGQVFGFLGANGAGKTTTMRIALGVVRPDEGVISWGGVPAAELPRGVWGYLPEERGLYHRMTVLDQLVYFGRLYGVPRDLAVREARAWLARFRIPDYADRRAEELSQGQPAEGPVHRGHPPRPRGAADGRAVHGLDPVNVALLREAFLEMRDRGKTLVFSTHQMETVETLCELVAIIDRGRLVVAGALRDVKRTSGRRGVTTRLRAGGATRAGSRTLPGVQVLRPGMDEVELALDPGVERGRHPRRRHRAWARHPPLRGGRAIARAAVHRAGRTAGRRRDDARPADIGAATSPSRRRPTPPVPRPRRGPSREPARPADAERRHRRAARVPRARPQPPVPGLDRGAGRRSRPSCRSARSLLRVADQGSVVTVVVVADEPAVLDRTVASLDGVLNLAAGSEAGDADPRYRIIDRLGLPRRRSPRSRTAASTRRSSSSAPTTGSLDFRSTPVARRPPPRRSWSASGPWRRRSSTGSRACPSDATNIFHPPAFEVLPTNVADRRRPADRTRRRPPAARSWASPSWCSSSSPWSSTGCGLRPASPPRRAAGSWS